MKIGVLVLMFLANSAWADIGSVFELSGSAIIRRGGTVIPIVSGTRVEVNDRVETKNGVVNIKFKDDTTVKITESSALVIDDFVYDPKSGAGRLGLKAAAGTVRYVSGNIAHNNPNAVNIKTPTATIAVRGTDFVMSVDETGKSAIILMPSCELSQGINLKGSACGSGKIDVDNGAGTVHMDRPYQATVVETTNNAPLYPVVVDLSASPIGNNLMITPPRTPAGVSIQVAARAAAERTGDIRRPPGSPAKDPTGGPDRRDDAKGPASDNAAAAPPTLVEQVAINTGNVAPGQPKIQTGGAQPAPPPAIIDLTTAAVSAVVDSVVVAAATTVLPTLPADTPAVTGILPTTTTTTTKPDVTGNTNVFKIMSSQNAGQQLGWAYTTPSAAGRNYASIDLPFDTKVTVTVTQDNKTDSYNFNGAYKSTGSITISQSSR